MLPLGPGNITGRRYLDKRNRPAMSDSDPRRAAGTWDEPADARHTLFPIRHTFLPIYYTPSYLSSGLPRVLDDNVLWPPSAVLQIPRYHPVIPRKLYAVF